MDLRNTHGGSDEKIRPGAGIDAADTAAGIGFEDDFIARAGFGLVGDPGGDTTSSIARDFGDRAVGIMQPDLALAAAVPGQELHPVGADALVAVAEPAGQLIPGLDACELLLHHQKVVSASMRFHKRNHSSSASWRRTQIEIRYSRVHCFCVMLPSRGHASV